MKQTFDTDTVIYKVLKASSELTTALSGGIYAGQRPDGSVKEDVVVSTIDLTQEYFPQIGTSNINIHVPDKSQKIGGVQMKIEDRERLRLLAGHVLSAIRSANVPGLRMIVSNMNTINESDLQQHFVNIRINWNIHE